jgi:DNA-binding Xre family transcriptional regulator
MPEKRYIIIRRDEIVRRREAMGLTLRQAAKLAGWNTLTSWQHVEKELYDNPRIETLARICRVLKCRIDDITEY